MKQYELKADVMLDCAGLACPMPIVRTKKTMETMEEGSVLEVQATDKGSLADLQAWARGAGHHYLGTVTEGSLLKHYVRKGGANEGNEPPKHPLIVTNDELKVMLDSPNPILLLDVREPAEYAFGHIPGAVSIPLGELAASTDELHSSSRIYVVCRTGTRSDLACRLLAERGFEQVHNVLPGMTGWQGQLAKSV